jgi:hypothetical protein
MDGIVSGAPILLASAFLCSGSLENYKGSVEALTGPIALHKQINSYQHTSRAALSVKVQESLLGIGYVDDSFDQDWGSVPTEHQLILLNETAIYPYAWSREGKTLKYVCGFNEFEFDPRRFQELLRTTEHGSYAITYWSHSWTSNGHHKDHLQNAG